MKTNTPIAYFIFNRPGQTEKSFSIIRNQRPNKLFIIADGPRVGNITDQVRCHDVRELVKNVDWPCEVFHNFSDFNLGCKRRVSSGLDWVFSQVDTAIVLEDDCLPHSDFFNYCDDLLDRYKNDERVWVITGNNFQDGKKRGDASYYFSKYNHCWGWATWRRAWQKYQVDMPYWAEWKQSAAWLSQTKDPVERQIFTDLFDRVSRGEIDTWDYQWTACVWYYGGLTATPNVNLVTNIGFGPDATHTVAENNRDGMPAEAIGVLTHPLRVQQDLAADRFVFDRNFGGKDHPDRFKNRFKRRAAQFLRAPSWLLRKLKKLFSH